MSNKSELFPETQITNQLLPLMYDLGNLNLHISGNAKVDFIGACPGTVSKISFSISGDRGCLAPYDNSVGCALDDAMAVLFNLSTIPHLNSSEYEKYNISKEGWASFVSSIETTMKQINKENIQQPYAFYVFNYLNKKTNETVVTVTVKLEYNSFVLGEYCSNGNVTYHGPIDDYDQPSMNFGIITWEGNDIKVDLNKLFFIANSSGRETCPHKGDILVYDKEADVYIVFQKEAYLP